MRRTTLNSGETASIAAVASAQSMGLLGASAPITSRNDPRHYARNKGAALFEDFREQGAVIEALEKLSAEDEDLETGIRLIGLERIVSGAVRRTKKQCVDRSERRRLHRIAAQFSQLAEFDPASNPSATMSRGRLVPFLRQRDGDSCWYCGLPLSGDITLEHLIPESAGGPTNALNTVLSHYRCNSVAGNLPLHLKVGIREKLMRVFGGSVA